MNRWTTAIVRGSLATATCLVLSGLAEPSWAGQSQTAHAAGTSAPDGPAVFEMKYRGLSSLDDPLSAPSLWGFDGSQGENDPFVRAVRSQVKECTVVYNSSLPQARGAVVELKESRVLYDSGPPVVELKSKKPVAFYFDLNADGKLSDEERFLPAPAGKRFSWPYIFTTSDFTLRGKGQEEAPFRLMLIAFQNGDGSFDYLWSPSWVLEGEASLAGVPTKLVLSANRFAGPFVAFGSSRCSLFPAEPKLESPPPRSPLSRLIQYQGTFYRCKLDGTYGKGRTLRVILEKDTTPTGPLTATLRGKEALQFRLASAALRGVNDDSIYFNLPEAPASLPEGRYRLSSAGIDYGAQKDNEWRVTIDGGPAFEIKAGQTRPIEMGALTLAIRAMDEQDRNRSDAKERSTFAKGTSIYLALEIKGKAGEVYTRFSQRSVGGNDFSDVKPHVAILDAGGKLLTSVDMEYG
jgi:hypothetical protein